jgi:hypothetical protein
MRDALREPLVKTLTEQITQVGHGFSLLTPVYLDGTWKQSFANDVSKSKTIGVVTRVIDTNRFEVTTHGKFKVPKPNISIAISDAGKKFRTTACSGDGKYQVLGTEDGDGVWVSSDYGTTWTKTSLPNKWYRSSAMSLSGKYQVLSTGEHEIAYSDDFGVSWTLKTIGSSGNFMDSVFVSSTGQYMLFSGAAKMYKSSDFGATWSLLSTGTIYPKCSAISDDGQFIITASSSSSPLFKSTDGGLSFSPTGTSAVYSSITCSSDGKYILASSQNGTALYASDDYGTNWSMKFSGTAWFFAAMSRNGKYQMAGTMFSAENLRFSSDYGNSWSGFSTPFTYNVAYSACVSETGNYFSYVVSMDGVYKYKGYGLAANTIGYLTEGGNVGEAPTTSGYVKKQILIGESDSSGVVNIGDGEIVGQITADVINENTLNNGVSVDGVLCKDSQVYTDQINEKTLNAGVTADGVTLKDGNIETVAVAQFTEQISAPSTPAAGKTKIYAKTDGRLYYLNSGGVETLVNRDTTTDRITGHTGHNFAVGMPLYDAGTNLAKGNCIASNTAETICMVSRIIDASSYEVITNGAIVEGIDAAQFKGGVLPADGDVCFLADEDGKLMTVPPLTAGHTEKPCFFVRSVSGGKAYGYFHNMRGSQVGSTNLYTANGPVSGGTKTLADISGHLNGSGGYIEGYIRIVGTTSTVTTFRASFSKSVSGTSYSVTPLFENDTLPGLLEGTSYIEVTSGGLIQLTLTTIPGFDAVNSVVVHSMQASAIGAYLPLLISGKLVDDQKTIQVHTGTVTITDIPSPIQNIFNSASPFTATIGTAVGVDGARVFLKNIGTGTVTVNFTGGQTCDGQSSISMLQYEYVTLMANNGNWMIVG